MHQVNEIFTSIQGEGVHTGTVMRFIRFSGCDMSCNFCDTDHSNSEDMTRVQIVEACKGHKHICLTGGEPGIQKDLNFLISLLRGEGHYIHIETNGRHFIPSNIYDDVWITCSPKVKSGENISVMPGLQVADEVKILAPLINIFTDDGKPRWGAEHKQVKFLQVVFDGEDQFSPHDLERAVYFVKEHQEWRLSMQLHKLIRIK